MLIRKLHLRLSEKMSLGTGMSSIFILSNTSVSCNSISTAKISRLFSNCGEQFYHKSYNNRRIWHWHKHLNFFSPCISSGNCKYLWTTSTDMQADDESKKNSNVVNNGSPTKRMWKKWNAPPDPSSAPKVKRAYTIKRLHKENKDLFGELLETKQEKVKRTRQELKLATTKTEEAKRTKKEKAAEEKSTKKIESLLAKEDKDFDALLKMDKRKMRSENLLKVGWLPRAESIKVVHAGMSINKNPIKLDVGQDSKMTGMTGKDSSSGVTLKAHKEAEIEWNLRSSPTKIKLIELSPTTSSSSNNHQDSQVAKNSMDASVNEQAGEIMSFASPFQASTSVKLPSVTKILTATMSEQQAMILKRWEEKMIAQMGEDGFRQYKESILTNGKMLHGNIESYLRGTPTEEISVAKPNQGHWNSLNGVLQSIDHVYVLESHVTHPSLQYCGVIDCVAEFRNKLVLIDWKTSQKPKPLISNTYDTPLQIAAYIGAINDDTRYSLKVDTGLIAIAYEDGSNCQTFMLSSRELDKYWQMWLKRLELYRQNNPAL